MPTLSLRRDPALRPRMGAQLDRAHELNAGLAFCHLNNDPNNFGGYDYSGNGITVTGYGSGHVALTPGHRNLLVDCDGTASYVALSAAPLDWRTTSITAIFYIQSHANTGNDAYMWSYLGPGSAGFTFGRTSANTAWVLIHDGTNQLQLQSFSVDGVPFGASSTTFGAWSQVAFVWDLAAKSARTYLNGVNQLSGSNSSLVPGNLPPPSTYLYGPSITGGAPIVKGANAGIESTFIFRDAKPDGFLAEHYLNPYGGFQDTPTRRWWALSSGIFFRRGLSPRLGSRGSGRGYGATL